MRYLLPLLLLAMPAQAASPITMTFTGDVQYNSPAFGYTTCHYRSTYPDLRVKIVVDTSCPYTIKYDPASGTWSK